MLYNQQIWPLKSITHNFHTHPHYIGLAYLQFGFLMSWIYFPLLCTGPMELKTVTLSAGMYILMYSFSLACRQEDTRRHSLGIYTLTNGRKGVNKGPGGKEVL